MKPAQKKIKKIIIHEYGLSPRKYMQSFDSIEHLRIEKCPNCNSHKRLYLHGSYKRYVIYFGKSYLIKIIRHFCSCCGVTYSVFPEFLTPHFCESIYGIFAALKSKSRNLKIPIERLYFYRRRFIKNMANYIELFRRMGFDVDLSGGSPKEKAKKLLEMVNGLKLAPLAKRYQDHFNKGLMAL